MLKFASILTAAVVSSTPAIGQDLINWTLGTKFEFVEIDRWKKEVGRWKDEVIRLDGDTYYLRTEGKDGEFTVSKSGIYKRQLPPASGAGEFTYQPVKRPLNESDQWEWVFHGLSSGSLAPTKYSRRCKAGKLEEVEVPSGKYTARSYECSGNYQVAGGVTGTLSRKAWYVPTLGVDVKRIDAWQFFGGRDETTTVLQSVQTP